MSGEENEKREDSKHRQLVFQVLLIYHGHTLAIASAAVLANLQIFEFLGSCRAGAHSFVVVEVFVKHPLGTRHCARCCESYKRKSGSLFCRTIQVMRHIPR